MFVMLVLGSINHWGKKVGQFFNASFVNFVFSSNLDNQFDIW